MKRPKRKRVTYFRVSVRAQTVLPREVREALAIHPGDTVRYRFTDQGVVIDKGHPEIDALVISSSTLDRYGMLWVAMITSAANESWSCDVPIDDLTRAGLPAESVVRPAKIAAIEPRRVLRRAGTVRAVTKRKVAEHLRRFLAAGAPARSR